jgi:hypothetical protein
VPGWVGRRTERPGAARLRRVRHPELGSFCKKDECPLAPIEPITLGNMSRAGARERHQVPDTPAESERGRVGPAAAIGGCSRAVLVVREDVRGGIVKTCGSARIGVSRDFLITTCRHGPARRGGVRQRGEILDALSVRKGERSGCDLDRALLREGTSRRCRGTSPPPSGFASERSIEASRYAREDGGSSAQWASPAREDADDCAALKIRGRGGHVQA